MMAEETPFGEAPSGGADTLLALLEDKVALKEALASPEGDALRDQLLDLYKEIHRYQAVVASDPSKGFVPNVIQAKVLASKKRGRFMFGSNRIGKSTLLVLLMRAFGLGYHPWLPKSHPDYFVKFPWNAHEPRLPQQMPVPNTGRLYVGHDYTAWARDLEKEWKTWVPSHCWDGKKNSSGHIELIELNNGSEIQIFSDQVDPQKAEGGKLHWLAINEPPKREHYEASKARLIDYNAPYIGAMTLLLKEPWVYDEIFLQEDNPDLDVFKGDSSMNSFEMGGVLSQTAIELAADGLDEDMKGARYGGIPLQQAGLILKGWKKESPYWIEPVPVQAWWPRFMAIDPHPQKPTAMLWGVVDPESEVLHIVYEMYDKQFDDAESLAAEIKRVEQSVLLPHWDAKLERFVERPIGAPRLRLIDPASKIPDGTNKKTSMFRELTQRGVRSLVAWDRADLYERVLAFRPWMRPRKHSNVPVVQIWDNCVHLAREIGHWYWNPKTGRPRKARATDPIQDNLIDCLMAFCTHDVVRIGINMGGNANSVTMSNLEKMARLNGSTARGRKRVSRGGY